MRDFHSKRARRAVVFGTSLLIACGGAATSEPTASVRGSAPEATSRSGYASINGLQMYYEVHGEGRPLVLLHGGGSSIRTTFAAVLPALAEGRQVIAPEQQAHGHTADIDRPLSFEQMADDTAALLRHLGVDQADVFGFSNGGNVAMQLAMRHPRLVRKLVVGSCFYANHGLQPQVRDMFQRPGSPADMPAPLRDEYLRVAPDPDNLPTLVDKLMAMLSGFQDWPDASLQAIDAPTMVLQGNSDVATTAHAVEMCRLIRGCTLVILPGGHGSYIGEATAPEAGTRLPSATVALVQDFLDQP